MSLSKPSHNRELIHQRHIECQGYRRDDGLWDIEGHLVDTKTYSFPNHDRGEITSGEPIHEMWLRLTVDEDFVIRDVEALTDYGPYRICPDATHSFDALKGIQIRPGWRKEINKRVGGVNGCTHLRELLGPVATTAFQAIYPIKARRDLKPDSRPQKPPLLLSTCHAYAPGSEVVKRLWPDYHRPEEKIRSDDAKSPAP